MSAQPEQITSTDSSEKKISAGMNRAFELYGPNLRAFFEAVQRQIKSEAHRGVQLDLPLTKSK